MSAAFLAAPPLDDLRFWVIARASLDYVRDTIEITRGAYELLDALILTAALDANMAPVRRAPDLQQAYGGALVSAPDDLRRPVSVNAVAQSLNLPFETVRRRALNLAAAGLCVIGPQGMVVPNATTTSAGDVAAQQARYVRARQFYETLKALGAVQPPAEPLDRPPEPPVRAANWALSQYVLRASADLIALTGNVTTSRVLIELILAGTRPLSTQALFEAVRDALQADQHEIVLGGPLRATTLAAPLNLPRETVRRHLVALETLGFCRREAEGVTAVVPGAMRERLADLARSNHANLQRLLASLARVGALADWAASPL